MSQAAGTWTDYIKRNLRQLASVQFPKLKKIEKKILKNYFIMSKLPKTFHSQKKLTNFVNGDDSDLNFVFIFNKF
jgi:DNA recombination-dependent growth factor C